MIESLLAFFLIGLVVLVAGGVLLGLVGVVFSVALSLAGIVLFKIVPIVLIGYLIVRFLAPRGRRLSAADREWLEDD